MLKCERIVFLVLVVACICQTVAGFNNTCGPFTPVPGHHDKPTWPNQFQVGVMSTMVLNDTEVMSPMTVEVMEYYDYVNNRAAVYSMENGSAHTQLYDFPFGQVFELHEHDGTCDIYSFLNDTDVVYFNATHGHVQQPSQIQIEKWLTDFNASFQVSDKKHHGVLVDKWSACVNATYMSFPAYFQLDYYVTQNTYMSPLGINNAVPFRSVMMGQIQIPVNGTDTLFEFNVTEDYVFYRPGPIEDCRLFEIPHGYFCKGRKTNVTQSEIPAGFSSQVEMVDEDSKYVTYSNVEFHYKAQLSRFDLSPGMKTFVNYNKYGPNPLTIIHDYGSGMEYVLDQVKLNCTVDLIPLDYSVDGVQNKKHTLLTMKTASDMLHMSNIAWQYQGEREFMGIPCDVWSGKSDTTHIMDVYYIRNGWTLRGGSPANGSMVGYWISEKINNTWVTKMKAHTVMTTYSANNLGGFEDIKYCYTKPLQMKHCIVKIVGTYETVVGGQQYVLSVAVRHAIASAAKVEELRITDIFFDSGANVSEVDVWFSILDKPPKKGDSTSMTTQPGVDEAFNNLKKNITTGTHIKLNNKSLPVKVGYIRTDKDLVDPRPSQVVVKHYGYSKGAMAGLGIAMLLIGLVVGIGAILIWQKRSSSHIPYTRDIDT